MAFAKALLAEHEAGNLRGTRVTTDGVTYGHPQHFEILTKDGKRIRAFNDSVQCPPLPPSFCDG